jgi:ribosomal protein S18 acetylase RimI-like enzyme
VLFHYAHPPELAVLRRWIEQIAAAGFDVVRTGAVPTSASPAFEAAGFDLVQTLVLLEHTGLADVDRPDRRTGRLHDRDHEEAAAVDLAAFGRPWAVDATGIRDVRSATVTHRARRLDDHGRLTAFAVSGRDRHDGFLQRLAVHPEWQHRGIGRALTLDSLRWMRRKRVHRALVNTHVGNEAARALYGSVGFVALPDPLIVYEHRS